MNAFFYPSTLGNDVIGIWPKNSDKGDINCAHLANSSKMLATGDDFGYVKLYQFPVNERYVSIDFIFILIVKILANRTFREFKFPQNVCYIKIAHAKFFQIFHPQVQTPLKLFKN